mgnify:CR=1 FL=1
MALWHKELKKERIISTKDDMQGSYLGPSFDDDEIEQNLTSIGATYEKFSEDKLLEITAQELSKEKTIGWFQGRMEFGPRALGNRSILYDPRDPNGKDRINRIKRREAFRPFAGSILLPYVHDWFDTRGLDKSPFMMYAMNCKQREKIPAVLHYNGTSRIQTVSSEHNYHFYNLIREF